MPVLKTRLHFSDWLQSVLRIFNNAEFRRSRYRRKNASFIRRGARKGITAVANAVICELNELFYQLSVVNGNFDKDNNPKSDSEHS